VCSGEHQFAGSFYIFKLPGDKLWLRNRFLTVGFGATVRSCEKNEESRPGGRLAATTGCPTFVINAAAWGRQSCLQAGVLAGFLSEQTRMNPGRCVYSCAFVAK
jgi:hypothetical protein